MRLSEELEAVTRDAETERYRELSEMMTESIAKANSARRIRIAFEGVFPAFFGAVSVAWACWFAWWA